MAYLIPVLIGVGIAAFAVSYLAASLPARAAARNASTRLILVRLSDRNAGVGFGSTRPLGHLEVTPSRVTLTWFSAIMPNVKTVALDAPTSRIDFSASGDSILLTEKASRRRLFLEPEKPGLTPFYAIGMRRSSTEEVADIVRRIHDQAAA